MRFARSIYRCIAVSCVLSGCLFEKESNKVTEINDCQICPPDQICEPCGNDWCGDGVCTGAEDCSSCSQDCGVCYDPDVLNVPGWPSMAPVSDLYALSQSLGVPPMVAGVPNISYYLQNPPVIAFSYPLGASSKQDFMNQLFQSGNWANTQPQTSVTPLPPDGYGCQLRQVDALYNPDEFVSFDFGAGLLYPSSLVQGAYVNLGVGSLSPIHVPYTQRNPVNLVSTFYAAATAPTATSTDVYTTIGQLIQNAQAQGGITQSTVYFDMTTASSLAEAAVKFKLDAKVFGGSINATFNQNSSTQTNTVFVKFTQSLFTVFQDLQGYTPTQGEFNNSLTVPDLENLGAMGEMEYNNLPTYVRSVTYGRMLIFSITSTSSQSDLEAAVNATYGHNSVSASDTQKRIINESEIKIFGYGGPADPTIAAIKAGSWQAYFTLVNVPLITLKPLGYEVRRFDDQLATMSRTTSFTERTCPGVHRIEVRMSDVYHTATLYLQKTGATSFQQVVATNSFSDIDINSYLVGSNDQVMISMQVGQSGFLGAYHGHVKLQIFVDGVLVADPPEYSCNHCHSRDLWVYRVNQYTGEVTLLDGP